MPEGETTTALDRLKATADALHRGEASPLLTVREFLWLWHAYRRGYWIVRSIKHDLATAGLTTAEIGSDASLFVALPIIVEHDYLLVRAPDKRVVGIVTTSDISLQFQQLAEPFLLLGEIENHIRRIIAASFGSDDLAAIQDPTDRERKVSTASDLTFGEYRRLLEEPGRWIRSKLPIDRVVFIGLLDRVRDIRNDVMHFDPDGIPSEDLEVLRDFATFLGKLQSLGVA